MMTTAGREIQRSKIHLDKTEIAEHPHDPKSGTPEPPPKDHLVIFLVLIVMFIPLTIFRAQFIQTTDSGIGIIYVFVLIGWILFVVGWICLGITAVTLSILRLVKCLHPNRAHILFIYAISSFFAIAVTLLHFALESMFPIDRISLPDMPWQKVHAIPLRILHTAVAACLVVVVVANSSRIRRQIETSPPERANNIALWVGLLVAIAIVIIVPCAMMITFHSLDPTDWFFYQ